MRIVIITDGNNSLGLGHIYQSITLADAINATSITKESIDFMTKSDGKVMKIIQTSGYHVGHFEDDDQIFEKLKTIMPDRIIFDKLDVSPILAKKIKEELTGKLIICTNLTEANEYADITVMAGMGSNFRNIYSRDNETGRVEFWGPRYWLIRSEFEKFHKSPRPSGINKILLIFGGSDQANLSTSVIETLLQSDRRYQITLVLGSAFTYLEELQHVIDQYPDAADDIHLLRNVNNVAELMFENDLTFVSPGLSFFESLLVGTPVICFHQNDFQKKAWENGILTLDKKDTGKIIRMIDDQSFYFADDKFITDMEIGAGKSEIVREILN